MSGLTFLALIIRCILKIEHLIIIMNELFRRSLLSVERGSKDNVATDRLGALLHFGGCVKIANRTRPIAHFATQLFKSLNASHDYTLKQSSNI